MELVKLSLLVEKLESGSREKGGSIDSGVISIGGTHLSNNGGFKWDKKEFISEGFFNKMRSGRVSKNNILIVKDGATTGKTSYVGEEFPYEKAAINEHVFKIQVDHEKANPKYIFYFLHSPKGQLEILSDYRGATVGGISREFIDKVKIPLPNLETQNKIVAVLDKANNLIEKREETLKKYDELLSAVFLDMFGNPSTNRKKFPLGTIRDLVQEVKYGTSSPAVSDGKYPYLRMNNITYAGSMDYSDLKFINIEESQREKYIVKKDDLLFNRTNSKELVGKTGIYDRRDEMVFAGYLIRVRANEKANTHYLWGYLNSLYGKQLLLGMGKSIVGMANINAQELQDINILIPPLELQNAYKSIYQKIDVTKKKLKISLSNCNELLNALSQLAFKGQLTFNIAVELETLLNTINLDKSDSENDIAVAINNKALTRLLVDRLNKREFENMKHYEKGKYVAFRILKEVEGVIDQNYSPEEQQVQLSVQ